MKGVHCIHYVVSKNFATEPVGNSYHKCPMSNDPPCRWCPCSTLDSDAQSCICAEDTGISHAPDEVPKYWNADADRPSANSTISAICAPVYDSLCTRGVSVQQSNGERRKMASPYKSPAFRLWPVRRKLSGKSPFGFCNKSLNEEPEVASTGDSRLNSDSDRLFELFWIQAAGQGHTS